MSTHFTLDRESFQKLLARAFLVQEYLDSQKAKRPAADLLPKPAITEHPKEANPPDYTQSLSAIVEVQRLIATDELDVNGAVALIADRARNVANAAGVAIGLLEGDELVYRAGSGSAAAYRSERHRRHHLEMKKPRPSSSPNLGEGRDRTTRPVQNLHGCCRSGRGLTSSHSDVKSRERFPTHRTERSSLPHRAACRRRTRKSPSLSVIAIAYLDLSAETEQFVSCPIQMKASQEARVGLLIYPAVEI